jgi:hypothetical protein
LFPRCIAFCRVVAATVQLEEDGYWGGVSFTDFFSLARIEGEWLIVNKTFAHTGGDPPPM